MKENRVNTGGCIQNNFLDVFCIAVHYIIKVSHLGPSWPSCCSIQQVCSRQNVKAKMYKISIKDPIVL